jgi:hypothetical protein
MRCCVNDFNGFAVKGGSADIIRRITGRCLLQQKVARVFVGSLSLRQSFH